MEDCRSSFHPPLSLSFSDSLNPDGLPEDELPEWVENERFDFKDRLDKNHDGVLNMEEMGEWLSPNDNKFFEEEADHLLSHADKNKVRTVSLQVEFSPVHVCIYC